MAVEERRLYFDVWAADDRRGTALGELTEASERRARRVLNGADQGSFTINRNSAQYAWCAPDNLVRVRQEPGGPWAFDDTRYVAAFLIASGDDEIVSPDEQGGEIVKLAGLGPELLLRHAVVDYQTHHPFNQTHYDLAESALTDGMWHIYADRFADPSVGTPGSVLRIFLRDAQSQVPEPITDVTHDFNIQRDSLLVDWSLGETDWQFAVGTDLLTILATLVEAGLHYRHMPSLLLRAFENPQGTDLSATITLQKGANVREAGTRQIVAPEAKSRVLVKGAAANGTLTYRWVADAGIEGAVGVRQGYLEYEATPTAGRLDLAGQRYLRSGKAVHDGPPTLGVLNETGQVALEDYEPGDLVGVDVPEFDGPYQVYSVTLVENEAGYIDPILEFVDDTLDVPDTLELPTAPPAVPPRASCAPCPGDVPYVPGPPAQLHFYSGTMTFLNGSGGGGGHGYADMTPVVGTTQTSDSQGGMAVQPSTTYEGHVEVVGANPGDLAATSFALDDTGVYPPNGASSGGIGTSWGGTGNQSWDGPVTTANTVVPGTIVHMNAKAQGISAPVQLVTVTWWFDPPGWVPIPASSPLPGQWWAPAAVAGLDGTTTGFTVNGGGSYQSGSLRLEMNGVQLQGGGVDFTETDPTAGTYTFTRPPRADAEVVQWHQEPL